MTTDRKDLDQESKQQGTSDVWLILWGFTEFASSCNGK